MYYRFLSARRRPAEVETLLGDPTKIKTKLGWSMEYDFNALVEEMVTEDRKQIRRSRGEH